MQLEVDTISKMDLNVLALSPKAAESVLSLKQGGFKIAQISMLINALQRILYLYSNQQTSATVNFLLVMHLIHFLDHHNVERRTDAGKGHSFQAAIRSGNL